MMKRVVPREAMMTVLSALVASVDILERAHKRGRQPKTVIASDKMFEQMMKDYHRAIEVGRDAVREESKSQSCSPASRGANERP